MLSSTDRLKKKKKFGHQVWGFVHLKAFNLGVQRVWFRLWPQVCSTCKYDMSDVNSSGFIRCLHLYVASFLLHFQPFATLPLLCCPDPLADVLTAVFDYDVPRVDTSRNVLCSNAGAPTRPEPQELDIRQTERSISDGKISVTAGIKWPLTEALVNCDRC